MSIGELLDRPLKTAYQLGHDARVALAGKKPEPEPPPPPKVADDRRAQDLSAFAANKLKDIPPPPPEDECPKTFDEMEKLDSASVSLFVGKNGVLIERQDVKQGAMDDCYVLAPMAALAGTPRGQALIKSMIRESPEGYVVTFPGTGKSVTVKKDELSADGARFGTDNKEIWVKVIEGGCAKLKGGYTAIGNRGSAVELMNYFCKTATETSAKNTDQIKAALERDQPVVVGTLPKDEMKGIPMVETELGKKIPLPASHAMAVTQINRAEGTVQLYDTVSNQHLFVPLADFQRCAAGVVIGSAP